MKIIRNWLEQRRGGVLGVPLPSAGAPPMAAAEVKQHRHREEVVRAAFGELLALTGIPQGWLSLVAHGTALPDGGYGIQARVVVRRWDVRLFQSAPEIERILLLRIQALDTTQRKWLQGVSWSFALPKEDEDAVPSLPHPAEWAPQAQGDCPPGWLQTQALDTQQFVTR